MPKKVILWLMVSLILPVALVGCAKRGATDTTDSAGGATTTVNVSMTEMQFEPSTLTAPHGASVTVKLKNVGVVPHDFTIDSVLGKQVHDVIGPGKSDNVTFAVPEQPGTIVFYCSQPGHRQAGMEGKIIVK